MEKGEEKNTEEDKRRMETGDMKEIKGGRKVGEG